MLSNVRCSSEKGKIGAAGQPGVLTCLGYVISRGWFVPFQRKLWITYLSWICCQQVAAAVAGAALVGAAVTEAATVLLCSLADARAERRAQAALAQQLAALVARAVAEPSSSLEFMPKAKVSRLHALMEDYGPSTAVY